VPTIASPTPAFRHAIDGGRNGLLAAEPAEWRDALEDLIADPERRRTTGLAARADVEARFSPSLRARELEAILSDALRTSGGGDALVPLPSPRASVASGRAALEPDARPDLELLPGVATSDPLGAGSRLVQRFRVGTADVRRLDLFTLTFGQRFAHHVRFRLFDARGRLVLKRRRRAAHAPDRSWWSFAVPRRRLACGDIYRLELSVDEPQIDAALSFALAAPTPDGDPARSAHEPAVQNGKPLGACLALRTFSTWEPSACRPDLGSRPSRSISALDHATTLMEALLACAAHDARERIVFVARDGSEQRFSLAALLARAFALRARFDAHGLRSGDSVVLVLPTGPELIAAYLAALLAGAAPALASTPTQRVADRDAYRRLLRGIVADAQPRLAYCDAAAASALALPDTNHFAGVPVVLSAKIGAATPDFAPHRAAPEDVATIQYSSGSTGEPKGVRLSHRAMLNNLRAVRDALELDARDVSVNWIPLYHDMGLIDAFLLPLLSGCKTVLLPTGDFIREPRLWLQALHRHRGTISWAPNFAYALCVERIGAEDIAGLDFSRWRLAINAAEPVLPETVAAFSERFATHGFRPEAMTPAWGLAENVTIATSQPPALPPRVDRIGRTAAAVDARAVPTTSPIDSLACVGVGRVLPGCSIEIREGEQPLGERAIGNIWLRSDSLFSGYAAGPLPNPEVTPAGWIFTGDRGYVADGDLFFVARAKDVIVIAGQKYAPHDVESAINTVPGVRRGCAAAFGVLDATSGTEVLCAVVETRISDSSDLDALASAIRAQVTRSTGLALRHLKLVPPEGVGKTTSGKLARGATRERYAALLA
jgi:acyl-CoA synthetase (AMP-forming)/AMP-acid ligase II